MSTEQRRSGAEQSRAGRERRRERTRAVARRQTRSGTHQRLEMSCCWVLTVVWLARGETRRRRRPGQGKDGRSRSAADRRSACAQARFGPTTKRIAQSDMPRRVGQEGGVADQVKCISQSPPTRPVCVAPSRVHLPSRCPTGACA